jgi:DNA-binding response OmpR family regulator
MTKPFVPEELLARVKAQIRRNNNVIDDVSLLKYENITFDTQSHTVKV